jgi:hypothetical protein
MKIRRKRKPLIIRVEATPLESMEVIDGLKGLSTDALRVELSEATKSESWLNGMGATFKNDQVADLGDAFIRSAGFARIAREVIALLIVMRDEKDGGPASPSAYL